MLVKEYSDWNSLNVTFSGMQTFACSFSPYTLSLKLKGSTTGNKEFGFKQWICVLLVWSTFFTTFHIIYIIRKNIYTEQVTPPPKKICMELLAPLPGFFQGGGYPTATWPVPTNRWLRRARCAMLVPLISQRASGLAWSWMMQGAKTMGACHLDEGHLGWKSREHPKKRSPVMGV